MYTYIFQDHSLTSATFLLTHAIKECQDNHHQVHNQQMRKLKKNQLSLVSSNPKLFPLKNVPAF